VPERSYLSIGQVLDLLKKEFPDLTISKIRFLESQGLLDPERTPSGYRKFYDPDIERLRFILRAQHEQYLPLKVIKGRLGMDVDGLEGDDLEGLEPGGGMGGEPEGLADLLRASVPDAVVPANGGDPASDAAGRRPPVAPSAARPPGRPTRPPEVPTRPSPALPKLELVADADTGLTADSISMTLEELAEASGLSGPAVAELERFGLVAGRRIAGTTYYDADCLEIAALAANFRAFGVEARHLRMYRTAVEREAGFFEQVVTPMLKQRNPHARRQAVDTLLELSRLGQAMRAAVLRQALRDHTGSR
jgi:DNA-binding transcriptional MerR regulator